MYFKIIIVQILVVGVVNAFSLMNDNESGENSLGSAGLCSGCGSNLSSEELTDLRLEFVKQQILKKLRLSKKPNVAIPASALPAPVLGGYTLPPTSETPPEYDEYYGRTEQKIIFPVEGAGICTPSPKFYTACLQFDLPPDIQPEDVSKAELWFYKEADRMDEYNQTFVISEAAHWDRQQKFKKTKPIAIYETNQREGWVRIDVAWALRGWLARRSAAPHALYVACRTCAARRAPLALHAQLRPFIVVNTRYGAKKRRQRHMDCSPGISECCRESLYVDFSVIEWDDWVIQPTGYHAYFCKGSCMPLAAITNSASYHHSIIKKYFHGKKTEMKPCCAPTTFSSLQLLYIDSNKTVTQKTLPNMVVESCGCM